MTGLLLGLLAVGAPAAGVSEALPAAQALRQLEVRDRILLNHDWGRSFTDAYYRHAPLAQLPIAPAADRPQKLALVCAGVPSDAQNLRTYLAREGYVVDICPDASALDAWLARGGYDLVVAEIDADREEPAGLARRVARRCPELARSVICAVKAGTGGGIRAGEELPRISLPLVSSTAVSEALADLRKRGKPLGGLCFLIRIGSSPILIAIFLALAAGLSAGSLLRLLPGRWSRSVAALAMAAGLFGVLSPLAQDLRPPAEARPALARLAALRRQTLSKPGRPLPSGDLDLLAECLDAASPRVRREAAYTWALAAMSCPGDIRRTELLIRALDDREDARDPRQRQWAAVALGYSGNPAAGPRLIDALQDPAYLVRHKAARALGVLRDPEAIGPLFRMTQEDLWYNAISARESLRQLGR
jgi:hypothetical protein